VAWPCWPRTRSGRRWGYWTARLPPAAGGSSRRPLVRFPNRTRALWVGDSPPRRGPVATWAWPVVMRGNASRPRAGEIP